MMRLSSPRAIQIHNMQPLRPAICKVLRDASGIRAVFCSSRKISLHEPDNVTILNVYGGKDIHEDKSLDLFLRIAVEEVCNRFCPHRAKYSSFQDHGARARRVHMRACGVWDG